MKNSVCLVVILMTLHLTVANAQDSGCAELSVPAGDTQEELRVYLDPVTGEISDPPPSELQAQEQQQQKLAPPDEIRQIVLPDGSRVADTGDRFVTRLHAEIIDGKLVTCHRSDTLEETDVDTDAQDSVTDGNDSGGADHEQR